MTTTGFDILALWERRGETPRDLAERVRRYASLARAALPADLDWFSEGHRLSDLCDSDDGMSTLTRSISEGVRKDQDIGIPEFGYNFYIHLSRSDPAPMFKNCSRFEFGAGSSVGQNSCTFYTDAAVSDGTDPRLVTYDVMRAHMMAIVWAFQPSWCTAAPVRLFHYLDYDVYVRPPIGLGWMTWLEPTLVKQMRPPPSYWGTIIEGYSDGSVFMATGKETLDVDNHQHRRCARAIHRQLDHLNYIVPFEGMRGRSPRVPPFPDAPPATWNAWGEDR